MFKIPAYERSSIWLLFASSYANATPYFAARKFGNGQLLSRAGGEQLASMFLLTGVGNAILTGTRHFFTKSPAALAAIYLMTDIKGCIDANSASAVDTKHGRDAIIKSPWLISGLVKPLSEVHTNAALVIFFWQFNRLKISTTDRADSLDFSGTPVYQDVEAGKYTPKVGYSRPETAGNCLIKT